MACPREQESGEPDTGMESDQGRLWISRRETKTWCGRKLEAAKALRKKNVEFCSSLLSHRVNVQVTKPVLFFISFIIHIFHVAFREQKCRIAHSPFLIWCLLASSEYKAHATTQHKQINKNQRHACAASQTHPAVLSLWALEVLFLLLVMPFPQPLLLLANSYSGLKARYNYRLLICVACSFTVLQQHTLYLAPQQSSRSLENISYFSDFSCKQCFLRVATAS